MNFSDTFKYAGPVVYSPNGKLIALSKGNALQILALETLQVMHQFTYLDTISRVEWSPDGSHILAALNKRSQIIVKSVHDNEWEAKIEEGLGGISYARWSPDSRHIIVCTNFNLRLNIWSLVDSSCVYIKDPKYDSKGLAFTSDGKFMALAERHSCKDQIGVYYTGDWTLVNHFDAQTNDLEDIIWTKDNCYILAWENSLTFRLNIYNPVNGLYREYIPQDQPALGIRSFSLSPNGTYTAAGGYNSELKLFSTLTWEIVTELKHEKEVPSKVLVYKEEMYKESGVEGGYASKYSMIEGDVKLQPLKIAGKQKGAGGALNIGVSQALWSFNSSYLATKHESYPNVVWIWDMHTMQLSAVLLQLAPVKSMAWSPQSCHLFFSTGSSRLLIWSPEGASVCDFPLDSASFEVNRIKWNSDGRNLVVQDKGYLMMAFPPPEFGSGSEQRMSYE